MGCGGSGTFLTGLERLMGAGQGPSRDDNLHSYWERALSSRDVLLENFFVTEGNSYRTINANDILVIFHNLYEGPSFCPAEWMWSSLIFNMDVVSKSTFSMQRMDNLWHKYDSSITIGGHFE